MSIKYSDSGFLDGADETKKLSFDVSGVTTGTTRTITMPDANVDLSSVGTPDDNSVTLAKMAAGTDGNLITYDASGDPAYVTTGTSGQVLTSGGAGVAPTFQTAAAGGDFSDGGDTAGADRTIGNNDNYALNFEIGGTTRLAIEGNGNTAIRVSSDVFLQHLYTDGVSDGVVTSYSKCNSTSGKKHYYFGNPNGWVGNIESSGSVTNYNTSSDYRLKENVVPMTGSITRLKALKPSQFNFIADDTTTVDGFLAHEAQAVVPECVSGTKDAVDDDGDAVMQGIDQSKLIPLLVSALQEAIARIEVLENN